MSILNFRTTKALLKKEVIEHKNAFFNVPAILISLVALAFIFGILVNGAEWQVKTDFLSDSRLSGFDLFNSIYAFSLVGWLGFMLLMLFFYFAGSFSADRKDNALLFWKSLPVSDLQIMGVKTLAGLTVFPAIILIWALISSIVGFAIFLLLGAFLPMISTMNSQTSFLTFINLQITSLTFISITLLWYLPLFSAVGLLGTLVRGWAVPAFILLLLLGKILEALFTLSGGGYFSDLISERFKAPFEAVSNIFSHPDFAARSADFNIGEFNFFDDFIGGFISEINWLNMIAGWVVAAIFIYIASEYRRRKIQA